MSELDEVKGMIRTMGLDVREVLTCTQKHEVALAEVKKDLERGRDEIVHHDNRITKLNEKINKNDEGAETADEKLGEAIDLVCDDLSGHKLDDVKAHRSVLWSAVTCVVFGCLTVAGMIRYLHPPQQVKPARAAVAVVEGR